MDSKKAFKILKNMPFLDSLNEDEAAAMRKAFELLENDIIDKQLNTVCVHDINTPEREVMYGYAHRINNGRELSRCTAWTGKKADATRMARLDNPGLRPWYILEAHTLYRIVGIVK